MPRPDLSFKGASIVNGAQTVSSIAKVADDSALAHVRVSIRVILLKSAPPGFGAAVTRTNNLQNRIELRDFVAQDAEQARLRQEMAIENIDYQFVRSDESGFGPASCELTEVTTALVCASGDSNLAVQLKTGIGRFFADLTKPPYKSIFNPSISGAKAFNAVVVQRHVDQWIESKKTALPKRSGISWGVLVHGNRILSTAAFKRMGANLSVPIASFPASFKSANLDAKCEEAYQRMITTIQTNYQTGMLAVLFKNPTKSKHVFDEAII